MNLKAHLDDKHLSRFLEADTPIIQDESQNKIMFIIKNL